MSDGMKDLELETGSGNVFADLGLEDAPELKLKSAIAGQINSILRHRHLTQAQAGKLLGVSQPKISALQNGKLHGLSLEKLLEFMARLDRNVEISFQKNTAQSGPHYFVKSGKQRIPVSA